MTIQWGRVAADGSNTTKQLPTTYTTKHFSCVANVFNKQAAGDHTIIWGLSKSTFTASNIDSQGRYFYEPLIFLSIGY